MLALLGGHSMAAIFFILVVWIGFSFLAAELLPIIFESIGILLELILRSIFITLTYIFKFIVFALSKLFIFLRIVFKHLKRLLTLTWFFVSEFLNESSDHDDKVDDQNIKDFDNGLSYEKALALLGLKQSFSQQDFKLAYRTAISKAHPDRGGSHEKAQAINQARDLIKKKQGWK